MMRRLRNIRNASIIALMLPVMALRASSGQAVSGNLAGALDTMATIPELESVAIDYIWQEATR